MPKKKNQFSSDGMESEREVVSGIGEQKKLNLWQQP